MLGNLFRSDKTLLLLLLLFVFLGNDDFDTTQLLLSLALFSTLDLDDNCENINPLNNNCHHDRCR